MAKAKVESVDTADSDAAEVDLDAQFSGELLTGMVVLWFKEAKKHAKPMPAIVQAGYPGGICDLTILNTNGMEKKEGVYHKGDPRLCDHYGKMSDNALRYGAWGFTPWTKDDYLKYTDGNQQA